MNLYFNKSELQSTNTGVIRYTEIQFIIFRWKKNTHTSGLLKDSSSSERRPPLHRSRSLCPCHCPPLNPPSGQSQREKKTFSIVSLSEIIQPKTKTFHTLVFRLLLKQPPSSSSSSSLKPSNSSSLSDWLNRRASSAVINLDLKHGACWQTHQASCIYILIANIYTRNPLPPAQLSKQRMTWSHQDNVMQHVTECCKTTKYAALRQQRREEEECKLVTMVVNNVGC